MNKNYRNVLIVGIISLSASNGIFGLEIPGKVCTDDRNTMSFRKAAGNYIVSHFALFGAIPTVSAGYIKLHTGGALKNSMTDFKTINWQLTKGLFKTMPVAAAGLYLSTTLHNHMAD